jgi:cell wall-associated NlpC family hydrolase
MTVSRQAIVAAARSYLGVRFHHQGRNRAGLDCAGLVVCVARDVGISTAADITGYSRTFGGAVMKAALDADLLPVVFYRPGDVLLMRFDGEIKHMAIVSDKGIIHAYLAARRVVEHRLDVVWSSRVVAAYALPGVVA